jgi:hypothetical protein
LSVSFFCLLCFFLVPLSVSFAFYVSFSSLCLFFLCLLCFFLVPLSVRVSAVCVAFCCLFVFLFLDRLCGFMLFVYCKLLKLLSVGRQCLTFLSIRACMYLIFARTKAQTHIYLHTIKWSFRSLPHMYICMYMN